jgi:DNA-binding XRE family transcriptional regulator
MTNLVYGLRDGRNDAYFYIGKTTVGIKRPLNHLKKSHNPLVEELIKEIESSKNQVYIDVIEDNIDLVELSNRESFWIDYYSQIFNLLNMNCVHKEINDKYLKIQNINIDETLSFLNLLNDAQNIVSNKRKHLRVTQEYLAKESGLNRSTICQIEKGHNISITSLIKVLNVLSSIERQNQKVRIL